MERFYANLLAKNKSGRFVAISPMQCFESLGMAEKFGLDRMRELVAQQFVESSEDLLWRVISEKE